MDCAMVCETYFGAEVNHGRPAGRSWVKISDDEWSGGQPVIQKQCAE